jgi:hypothetical protein
MGIERGPEARAVPERPEPAPRPARGWSGRALVPGLAFALADVAWRVAFRLLGLGVLPTIDFPRPTELHAPWWAALRTALLALWLVLRPGWLPATLLAVLEALAALSLAPRLALYAWEWWYGIVIFQPDCFPGSACDPVWTEALHLTLHLMAVALLLVGIRRHRRALAQARGAAVVAAFD